jgi:hypothetical protein
MDGPSRDFGQLESKVEELLRALDMERKGRRRLHKLLDGYAKETASLGGRVSLLEDTTEGHGRALVDFEMFRTSQTESRLTEMATVRANRRWLKYAATAIGALGGVEADHATGGKIMKFFSDLFSAKP